MIDKEVVLNRWPEYVTELFINKLEKHLTLNKSGGRCTIIMTKVEAAMETEKNGKSPGDNGIAVEILVALEKYGAETV